MEQLKETSRTKQFKNKILTLFRWVKRKYIIIMLTVMNNLKLKWLNFIVILFQKIKSCVLINAIITY